MQLSRLAVFAILGSSRFTYEILFFIVVSPNPVDRMHADL